MSAPEPLQTIDELRITVRRLHERLQLLEEKHDDHTITVEGSLDELYDRVRTLEGDL